MSKTGDRDVSILLDSGWLQWLAPMFQEIRKGDASERLFPFNYRQVVVAFSAVCAGLNLKKVVPHRLRHSGASADRGDNSRTILEVQRRGQWRAASSVQRYEKAARLATSVRRLGPELLAHAQECERQVAGGVLFGKPAPTAPFGAGAAARGNRR